MKKYIAALIILLIATASYASLKSVAVYLTVERVVDGDTIRFTNGERVSLIGIDTPESRDNDRARREAERTGQDVETINKMGQEATTFVRQLGIAGQEVRLVFDVQEKDKYRRLLAYVFIPSCLPECPASFPDTYYFVKDMGEYWHIFLNATVIKAGYATPMTIPPNVKYADLFKELYKEAIKHKRGLWDLSCVAKDDCKYLACSSYDNPIKEGYKSDCVDGDCKCMCYGCK